tara:strand:- start:8934 stop:10037 length:1104 start_codon:yes stop_codon:yes gene_type:complete
MAAKKGLEMSGTNAPVTIESWLESKRDELFGLLPSNIHKERFLRNIIMQIKMNDGLKNCSISSIAKACVQASTLGLDIGVLGSAYLVPYGKDAQLAIGYQGYIDLAYRSGMKAIRTGIVRENDSYTATHEDFTHEYDPFGTNATRGPVVGVYAIVIPSTGVSYSELMSVAEIDQIRSGSRSANSPAWRDHWGEMAKKVVIRRALKRAPMSTETKEIIQGSDNAEFGYNKEEKKTIGKNGLRESLSASSPKIELETKAVVEEEKSIWDDHKKRYNKLSDNLGLSKWNRITGARKMLLIRRIKEQGYKVDQVEEFWDSIEEGFLPFDQELMLEGATLELLIRVPLDGGVDYFREVMVGEFRPEKKTEGE